MSRSALWHQEKNVQRRQQEADEAWEAVVEEGRNNRARNLIPLWGPDDSFRFEPMLLNNIKKSNYFVKLCNEIKDWTALVDEIYYKVEHMEPWAVGGTKTPSPGFCLLLRLLTLRSTTNQMTLMLDHVDSPYIRAIGFLYLRYTCDPPQLFKWFQPYLFDDEPIQVSASQKRAAGRGNNNNNNPQGNTDHTIGSFVRMILSSTSRDYCGTMLPRLPIQVERDIQVSLLQAEKIQKRADAHFRNRRTMDTFQKLGSAIMATYEDEENPSTWYRAEVDRVVLRGEDGSTLKYPQFVVTFTEYGNTETVSLGEMDVLDGPFYKEDMARGSTGGDGYDEVRKRERETVTASGRDYYSRPPTTKKSLAGGGNVGRASSSDRQHRPGERSSSPPRRERPRNHHSESRGRDNDNKAQRREPQRQEREKSPPKKRSAEEIAAIQQKKRKLMAKYG